MPTWSATRSCACRASKCSHRWATIAATATPAALDTNVRGCRASAIPKAKLIAAVTTANRETSARARNALRKMPRTAAADATAMPGISAEAMAGVCRKARLIAAATTATQEIFAGSMAGVCRMGTLSAAIIAAAPASYAAATMPVCRKMRSIAGTGATARPVLGAREDAASCKPRCNSRTLNSDPSKEIMSARSRRCETLAPGSGAGLSFGAGRRDGGLVRRRLWRCADRDPDACHAPTAKSSGTGLHL